MMNDLPSLFVLGDAGVGKTSVLFRYVYSLFPTHYNCDNEDCFKQISVNEKNIHFKISMSEIECFESLKYLNCSHIKKSDGFIFVFSLTLHFSLTNLKENWCPRVYEIKQNENKEHIPMVLVGNKSDLTEKRNISMREITKIMKKFDLVYIECSAKTNVCINCVFEIVAKDVVATNKISVEKLKRCILV